MLAPAASQAARIAVTTHLDEHDDPGPGAGCSLREAITAANTDGAFGGCSAADESADTITLVSGLTYARTLGTLEGNNASGDYNVLNEPLTIQLPSPGSSPATIQANSLDRVFTVSNTLTISGVLVTGGDTTGPGGGFFSTGTLTVSDSSIVGNSSALEGGGIFANGPLTLRNVTLSGNDADSHGGGLYLATLGTATLNNVTAAGNTADSNADDVGSGGGIRDGNSNGGLTIRNTLVGNNTDSGPTLALRAHDCAGTITSDNYNLVEDTTNCTFTPAANDLTGQDPAIDALAQSDGRQVHKLQTTSPARDAGNNTVAVGTGGSSCETRDQRNRPRSGAATGFMGEPRCDIGAFELQASGNSVTITDTDPDSPSSDASPEVKGMAISDYPTVQIFTQANCGGSVAASGTNAQFTGGTGITTPVPTNTANTLSARGVTVDGVPGACSNNFPYTHDDQDPAAPTINDTDPNSPGSDTTPNVKGTASADTATLRVFDQANCAGAFTTGTKAEFEGAGIASPVVDNLNGSNMLSAISLDAAGNAGACSNDFTYVHDDIPPGQTVLAQTDPESPSSDPTPLVQGTVTGDVAMVQIFKQANCGGSVEATGTEAQLEGAGIEVSVNLNANTVISANAIDAAGNIGECNPSGGNLFYDHDNTGPAAPSITSTNPPSGSNNNSPLVIGTGAESGSTVQIFRQAECPAGAPLATGPEAQFESTGLPIAVADNTSTALVARGVDDLGNIGPCGTTPFTYQEVTPTLAPPTPVLPKKKCKKGRKLKKGKCVKKKKKK
jgi:CSLREA domain-containing protein